MAEKIEYPKFKYHKTEAARIVHTEHDEKALGEGWTNSPADHKKKDSEEIVPPAKAVKPEVVDKISKPEVSKAKGR